MIVDLSKGTIDAIASAIAKKMKEPKTGHWIDCLFGRYECSECGCLTVAQFDYCPKCNAKMVEPQESEE